MNVHVQCGPGAERTDDPVYLLSVLHLAERWAGLMEQRLSAGEIFADMAGTTLRMVISSTALDPHTHWGDVVAEYLEDCWLYGREYREWYGPSPPSGRRGRR